MRMDPLLEILAYILSTIGALLPIVNPISAAPMVVSITTELTAAERTDQIRRACLYMFFILTAFLTAGGLIMSLFGISIPGLRIAGGLVICFIGFRMLFPEQQAMSAREKAEAITKHDISFTPLAMPGLAGPGSIAVVIGMSTTAQQNNHVILRHVLIAVGIAITALICFAVLRAATKLAKMLGANGVNAVARIMGFLLICIGVQFAINGVVDIARSVNLS
jgi:multiple antibiotic resistance protein